MIFLRARQNLCVFSIKAKKVCLVKALISPKTETTDTIWLKEKHLFGRSSARSEFPVQVSGLSIQNLFR